MIMKSEQENRRSYGSFSRIGVGPIIAALLGFLIATPAAFAQVNKKFGWSDWWLPHNYSAHGGAIDGLFIIIFWITVIALVLVQAAIIIFLIKYRYSPNRAKSHFIHGNT